MTRLGILKMPVMAQLVPIHEATIDKSDENCNCKPVHMLQLRAPACYDVTIGDGDMFISYSLLTRASFGSVED